MTWDPLLADHWPAQWSPISIVVRPRGDTIELVADGHLDAWTVGTLVRNLAAVYEPSFTDVHLDLRRATGCGPSIEPGLTRCRNYALSHGAAFRVTPPPSPEGVAPAIDLADAQLLDLDDSTRFLAG